MITQDDVKDLFNYDPDTGIFTAKIQKGFRAKSDVIGRVARTGYLRCTINKKEFLLHRLAWLYVHGELPPALDHINQIKTDNRICNLRPANHSINGKNRPISSNNTSMVSGATWHKASGKWQADIKHEDKRIYLGLHDDFFEAVCARKSAESKYGYHENHGRLPS